MRLAIFASGSGTNAQNIVEHFHNDPDVIIDCFVSNNPNAYVLKRAEKLGLHSVVFDNKEDYKNGRVLQYLQDRNIDFIVLAGFLWLIPKNIVDAYHYKIVNIHPALLPKYGGKGMYGMNVHKMVIEEKQKESGITIHYVNEKYDDGDIIFQTKCNLTADDTPESCAEKIHALEYEHFPVILERLLNKSI